MRRAARLAPLDVAIASLLARTNVRLEPDAFPLRTPWSVRTARLTGMLLEAEEALKCGALSEAAVVVKKLEEFLEPLDLSQNRVAREIGVPPRRVNEIVLAKRAITPDTALRLARYFGTSERFWLGLQTDYDLEEARLELEGRLEREVQPLESVGA